MHVLTARQQWMLIVVIAAVLLSSVRPAQGKENFNGASGGVEEECSWLRLEHASA